MKKSIWITVLALLIAGCASKAPTEGIQRTSFLWYGNQTDENNARIRTVQGLKIWAVNGSRIASIVNVMVGNAYDAISVPAGVTSISAVWRGRDVDIGKVNYQANQNYLINSLEVGDRLYFWVENSATGEVVYGEKKVVDQFSEK